MESGQLLGCLTALDDTVIVGWKPNHSSDDPPLLVHLHLQ